MADDLVWDDSWMADHQVADGWWIADDGRWFAPHLHPDVMAAAAPAAVEPVAEDPPLVAARSEAAPVESPNDETPAVAAAPALMSPAEEAVPQAEHPTAGQVQPPLPYWVANPEPGSAANATTGSPIPIPKAPTPMPTSTGAEVEPPTEETTTASESSGVVSGRTTTKPSPSSSPSLPTRPPRRWRRLVGLILLVGVLGTIAWFVTQQSIDNQTTADEAGSTPATSESSAAPSTSIAASTTVAAAEPSPPSTANATTSAPPASTAPTSTTTEVASATTTPPSTTAPTDATDATKPDGDAHPGSTERELSSLELKQLRDELYGQDLFAVVALSDAELSATAARVCDLAEGSNTGEDYDVGVGRVAADLDVDILVALSIGQVVLEQGCPDEIDRLGL